MKRSLSTLIGPLVCAVVLATACGVAKPNQVASTGSSTLSADTFAALLKSSFINDTISQQLAAEGAGQSTTNSFTVGGTKARAVLGLYVRTEQMLALVKDLGGKVTEQDRATGATQLEKTIEASAQQAAQLGNTAPTLSGTPRQFVLDYLVAGSAVNRLLEAKAAASDPTEEAVAAYFAKHEADYSNHICFEGLKVADEALLPQARAALEAGQSAADVIDMLNAASTDGSPVAAVLFPYECYPAADIPEDDDPLGEPLHTAAIGVPTEVKVPDQQGGVLGGIVRIKSRGPVGLDNPDIAVQIAEELKSQASAEIQTEVLDRAQKVLDTLDVRIDSRYGKFDPSDPDLVVPTASVRPASTTTTAPLPLGFG